MVVVAYVIEVFTLIVCGTVLMIHGYPKSAVLLWLLSATMTVRTRPNAKGDDDATA